MTTSLSAGETLTQPPTEFSVTFDQPMNIAEVATQTFQVVTPGTVSAIYIEADDGTVYDIPRLESYDPATDTATFVLLDALPDGNYQLHLSGADGLADLGGNPLVGNDPGGDYVVAFAVDAPPRGDGGNPLEWSDQASNDQAGDPQDLGILFPDELAAGVTISRDFSQDPQDTADVYQFQVLLNQTYIFTLSGDDLPPGVTISVTDPSGQAEGYGFGGTLILAQLVPGTYLLTVSGWDQDQAAGISYQVGLTFGSQDDNAPPLLSGPAPAVAIQLASVAPPSTPAPPTPVAPPSPVADPPVTSPVADPPGTPQPVTGPMVTPPVTDPSPVVVAPTNGSNPSAIVGASSDPAIAIPPQTPGIPAFTGASPLSLVALANSSMGGVTGTQGLQASSDQFVQNAAASPQSMLTTALVVVTTSFPILGPGEGMVVDPNGPEVVEGPMIDVETSRIAADPTRSEEGVLSISSTIGALLEFRSMSPPLPSDPETAAVARAGRGRRGRTRAGDAARRGCGPILPTRRGPRPVRLGAGPGLHPRLHGPGPGGLRAMSGLVHRDGRRAVESDPCRAEPDAATVPSRRRGQEG